MKATGIVRRIDDLGRIVIPKEIRRSNGWKEGDAFELLVDKENDVPTVIFRPYLAEKIIVNKSECEIVLKHLQVNIDWARENNLPQLGNSLQFIASKVNGLMETDF